MMRSPHLLALIPALALASACSDDGMIATTESTDASSSSAGANSTSTSTPTTTTPTPTTTDASSGSTTLPPCITGGCDPSTGASTTDSPGTTDASTGTSTGSTGSTGDSTGGTGDSTGASTGSSGSTGAALPCENGAQDQDETDVDCGGMVCGPCSIGQVCLGNSDCQSMACADGLCVVPACLSDLDCATACDAGSCDLGAFACVPAPINEGQPCQDDLCATDKTCQGGACAGGQAKDCVSFDTVCGTGACDPDSGDCYTGPDALKDGLDCDDLNACTAATTCQGGGCGDPNDPGYLLSEDFADPDPAWELAQGWEIGAAVESLSGGGGTGKDPATDHTASADNQLAGQFIGGLITAGNTMLGQFNCLTSPAVDTSALPQVWVTFWRHLHSDYANFAVNRIQVFDGQEWVTLEQGYLAPATNDAGWMEVKFDISAYKSATTQVRICHQRNAGAYNHPGWSVDDFTIGPTSCTP